MVGTPGFLDVLLYHLICELHELHPLALVDFLHHQHPDVLGRAPRELQHLGVVDAAVGTTATNTSARGWARGWSMRSRGPLPARAQWATNRGS
eukprot:2614639-Alexandrium_andersonii.AAC.1